MLILGQNYRLVNQANNPRTTNGAEDIHMHFNSQFYISHPHIHQIIQILTEIQVNTDLKIN